MRREGGIEKFCEYLSRLPREPSKVKQLILETLWNAGESFPRQWVQSSKLLELTEQKYFDRRIRELRDNKGCDIETGRYRGESAYRLNSASLASYNPRQYLTARQKKHLFRKLDYTCQICGKHVVPGARGLQADHKVPLSREGTHEEGNWQPLCNECNVAKRRACEGCKDNCDQCPWAFPERAGSLTLVRLPATITQEIRKRGWLGTRQVEEMVVKAVLEYLSGEDGP